MKINRHMLIIAIIAIIALFAAGCRPAEPTSVPFQMPPGATIVAATLNAPKPATETLQAVETLQLPPSETAPAETPTPTASSTPTLIPSPTASTGEVSGRICYRTNAIPAMTAFFQDAADEKQTSELKIAAGQNSYTVGLPPGKYIAFAWLEDYSRAGCISKRFADGDEV
jgi:hypothetical protein